MRGDRRTGIGTLLVYPVRTNDNIDGGCDDDDDDVDSDGGAGTVVGDDGGARVDEGADEPVGGDVGISSGGASSRTGLVGSES